MTSYALLSVSRNGTLFRSNKPANRVIIIDNATYYQSIFEGIKILIILIKIIIGFCYEFIVIVRFKVP